jgi:energy-coupling factor transport system substrate-specific component
MFKRFSTQDLIIIASLAGIGIAVKPIVGPLVKMVATPLMLPGGSLAGGLYMMWLVLAVTITGKTGTGFIFGLLQSLVVMVIGIRGNQGLFSLVSYTLPGILADLVHYLARYPEKLYSHLLLCALANMAGAGLTAVFIFRHPLPLVIGILVLAMVSGLVGGAISYAVYKPLKRFRII